MKERKKGKVNDEKKTIMRYVQNKKQGRKMGRQKRKGKYAAFTAHCTSTTTGTFNKSHMPHAKWRIDFGFGATPAGNSGISGLMMN
jgi:hypothetical protein